MLTRRSFLKLGAGAFAGLVLGSGRSLPQAGQARAAVLPAIPGGSLDPTSVAKYATQLIVPPAMPVIRDKNRTVDLYTIGVRQFQQQILPGGPPTTVWSYGSVNHPGTFNYPSFTIEAAYNRPVNITWRNELVDAAGNFLPHLLPVDPTLHWANPPGGTKGRDMRPMFTKTPDRYTGPVPMVTHVHGAHTTEDSDGYPEAWFLPNAMNIPKGYARTGTFYDYFNKTYNKNWAPGEAGFRYPNDQRATTLWYHDHTLGMTRLNVYAGPAGFYLIRGGPDDLPAGVLPGPAPAAGMSPFGRYYEIPIAIQDRSFNADGSLFYPGSREFFDEATASDPGYVPNTDLAPIWNPEFFGNTMVVNGRTWPYLEVEPRRYRFRLLNGCNSRFLILKIVAGSPASGTAGPEFWQIGAEGGFLPQPVQRGDLLMSPAERADVIVDFTGASVGSKFYLINIGPDEPFGGGTPGVDFATADAATTAQVMEFQVVPLSGQDTSTHPSQLTLPSFTPLGAAAGTRQVSLNELASTAWDGPAEALLGTMGVNGPVAMKWMDKSTENPVAGSTEVWEIFNFTEDAHPIHIHLVQFQVIGRAPFGGGTSAAGGNGPLAWEKGYKDTVTAYPHEITRVKARFDTRGRFVWHCHIVEHEDNEMMRPYMVV